MMSSVLNPHVHLQFLIACALVAWTVCLGGRIRCAPPCAGGGRECREIEMVGETVHRT